MVRHPHYRSRRSFPALLSALFAGVFMASALPPTASPAQSRDVAAGPAIGSELGAWAPGVDLRFQMLDRYANGTDYIWRLRPGGRADGTSSSFVNAMSMASGYLEQEDDVGRWRIDGGRLCVAWPKFFYGRERCYQVEILGPRKARFIDTGGGPSFLADWSRAGGRY